MTTAIPTDSRLQQLENWLRSLPGLTEPSISVASADASFRRYFRIRTDAATLIAMDAPPEKEDIHPFIAISERLTAAGVRVPAIFHRHEQAGFLLLEDFGDQPYLSALDTHSADHLYGQALSELARIQQTPTTSLPRYDAPLLNAEMALFQDWYLERHLGHRLTTAQQAELQTVFEALIENALAQPQTFVHRDYHSRNLMVLEENRPGVIDYQDAVVGPITYDLVSLLRDCYIRWPRERVEHWALAFRHRHPSTAQVSEQQFLRWFDLMGVQRHLKAIGIFARLHLRDGKSGYLDDIPRTLGYLRDIAPRHPETRPLAKLLASLE